MNAVAPGWVPDAATLPATRIVRFADVARRHRASRPCRRHRLRRAARLVGSPPGGVLGRGRRLLRGRVVHRATGRARRAPDAGRGLVPRGQTQHRAAPAAPRSGRPRGRRARHRGRRTFIAHLRPAARAGCRGGRTAARAGGRAGRPGRRLPPELPRGRRRLHRGGAHRRGLGAGGARLRLRGRGRPPRTADAEGAHRGVGIQVRRACPRPPVRGERAARAAPRPRAHHHGGHRRPREPSSRRALEHLGRGLGGHPRRPGGGGALRPPAVGALHVRHDRQAQGDRARARWGAPGAAGVARPAHGPARGRRLLLVHDAELDDVERPGLRAAARGDHRALRRAPDLARAGGALAGRGRPRRDRLRHQPGVPRGVRAGRPGARARPRPVRRAADRGDRLGAAGIRQRVGARERG